jgi:hypothetical protein
MFDPPMSSKHCATQATKTYLAQGEKILRKVDNGDITDSEALSS